MSNLILPGRRNMSKNQEEYQERLKSALPLLKATKDINRWKREIVLPAADAPKSCTHVLQFTDTITGMVVPYPIDEAQADEHGEYEKEHNRITEFFTMALNDMQEMIDYVKRCNLLGIQPSIQDLGRNRDTKAKTILWKGDHGNNYG